MNISLTGNFCLELFVLCFYAATRTYVPVLVLLEHAGRAVSHCRCTQPDIQFGQHSERPSGPSESAAQGGGSEEKRWGLGCAAAHLIESASGTCHLQGERERERTLDSYKDAFGSRFMEYFEKSLHYPISFLP